MDPISATLAVITFATAVKDIIELGQKIQESFAKASNNFRSAQRIAVDIKEMLEEIGVFCDEHADRLENMKDFKAAVFDLVGKLRTFEASVLPLLPKAGKGVSGRLIRGWDAWRKSTDIEASIVELQSDIVKVMRRHMLKSSMRAEVKLEAIHQTTSLGLANVKDGLDRVHRDFSALRITTVIRHTPMGSTDEELEQNIVAFANSSASTSAPMLRSPTVITVELMNKAYISFQIHDISSILERMSESKLLAGSTSNDAIVPYMEFRISDDGPVQAMASVLNLGHDIVRQLTEIRGLLDSRVAHIVSFSSALSAFSGLQIGLRRLKMDKEAILVSEWTVKLARMHLKSYESAQPDAVAHLALALVNQSTCYANIGDHDKALQAAEEAHGLSQGIQSIHPRQYFGYLHAAILVYYAILVDDHRSVGMLTEAVQLLDTLLGVRTFTEDFIITEVGDEFLTQLVDAAQSWNILHSYGEAVLVLGRYLLSNGKPRTGADLQHLAILVYRKLPDDRSTEPLARALFWTALDANMDYMTVDQALEMVDESAQLYRALSDRNPVFYASKQAQALLHKASLLDDLNRRPEAIATWEEIAALSKQILQDEALYAHALNRLANQFRELDRHQDAVRTLTLAVTTYTQDAEAQAGRYFLLGSDYARLHQYAEALQAVQTSAAVYRRLALKDPGTWTNRLALILAFLAQCFVALGDYAEARLAWKESISILEKQLTILSTVDRNASITDFELRGVDVVTFLSSLLEDKNDCFDLRGAVARIQRCLSGILPSKDQASNAMELVYGEILLAFDYLRLGHPMDSERHLTDTLVLLEIPRPHISASTRSFLYISTLSTKACALDAQGHTEEAILSLRKAQTRAKPLCLDYENHSRLFIEATTRQARFLASLGQTDEAHHTAAEALRMSRYKNFKRNNELLAWALRAAAFTALASGQFDLALGLAEEGCNVWETPENLKLWRDCKDANVDTVFGRPSLMGLMSSALLHLERIEEALTWAQRAVDASLEMRNTGRMRISASTARQSYMETNGRLAIAFLASGRLYEAKDILEKTRGYYAQRVDRVMGDNRELAPILLALSLLYCHEGRHEEGHAAGKELRTLLESLGYAFASLEKQVKIRLRQVYKGPPGRILCDIEKGLTCGFHTSTCSLLQF